MALTAKKVYAILKRQISDMEAKLNSPVRYRGTVATADLLPLNPDIGDMYNIESKSVYGEAGMNVAWNGVVWDTMGAPIDMSLYLTKEEAETVIQRLVTEYFEKNPVKPGATTEQAQQIEQNKTDIASLKTETGSLKEDLDIYKKNVSIIRRKSKNILNENNSVSGHMTDGTIKNNTEWKTTDFIEVDSSAQYIISYDRFQTANTQPFVFINFFDKNKSYISYVQPKNTDSYTFKTPINAKFIRVSLQVAFSGMTQIEKGNVKTLFAPFFDYYAERGKPTIIRIKSSDKLRAIFSRYSDGTDETPYIFELEEGIYNTLDLYTEEEKNDSGFYGLFLPDFSTLKGVGTKEKTKLVVELTNASQTISTINLRGTSSLENITVIGTKTMYAVHDDFGYGDYNYCNRYVNNCDFIVNQATKGASYGSGIRSGAKWYFKNCFFKNTSSEPFSVHSNTNFNTYADVTLENCKFEHLGGMSVFVRSVNSGVKNKLHLIGCMMNGVKVNEEPTAIGTGIDWIIDGHGNTRNSLYQVTKTKTNDNFAIEFSDECIRYKAVEKIVVGDTVYHDSMNCALGNTLLKLTGVAITHANSGEFVTVKTNGVISKVDANIESLTLGDKIVMSNHRLVVDNNATDYIGICKDKDFITLCITN
jgi:hypothetical protein